MPQTPNSSTTAFATPAELAQFRDYRIMAQWIKDDDTIATYAEFLASPVVQQALLAATGEIETAASVGGRYRRDDLAALTGAALVKLKQLCCDLAFAVLARRRLATVKSEDLSGVEEAYDLLDKLKNGERIFPLQETQDAGLGTDVNILINQNPNNPPITWVARRYFGRRNGTWLY